MNSDKRLLADGLPGFLSDNGVCGSGGLGCVGASANYRCILLTGDPLMSLVSLDPRVTDRFEDLGDLGT